jgi:hypothetical protein
VIVLVFAGRFPGNFSDMSLSTGHVGVFPAGRHRALARDGGILCSVLRPREDLGRAMNRRTAWFAGVAVLALVVLGVLVPSLRAGELTASVTALTTVVVAAVIAGTLLSVGTRER